MRYSSLSPRPVTRDERERTLVAIFCAGRPGRLPALDDDEPGAVLGIVLDRFRKHVKAVPGSRRLARDRGGARLALLRDRARRPCGVVVDNGTDLPRVQVRIALGKRLRMRECALDWPGPSEEAVTHREHVLADDAQSRQIPQQVGHFLHDARAAVLDRQHRGVHRAHRQSLERQAKGGKANRFGVRK